jgi:ABC-type uncharacterized transport system permease subunit
VRILARARFTLIRVGASIVAVVLALLTAGGFLFLTGLDPLQVYSQMVNAAIGDPYSLSAAITKSVPRLVTGLGIAIALRAGLWNVGAEGQLYMGATGATAIAVFGPRLPFPLGTGLALTAAVLVGAAWSAIPGILRAVKGVSEVITSLMMVYIAIQVTNYLVEGPWGTRGATFPQSPPIPGPFRLPLIAPGFLVNAGAVIALLAVFATWTLFNRTSLGLEMKAVGGNWRAAHRSGVRVGRTILVSMLLSGAFAGLAGGIEVLGVRGVLIEGFSPGYGFDGIAVALLGQQNPLGIVAASMLFGGLDAGGIGLVATSQGLPYAFVQTIEGLAVVFVLLALGVISVLERRAKAREALSSTRAVAEAMASTVA